MSKKNTLRLSLVQANLAWENPVKNLAAFDRLLADVKKTDVVVLPEMFSTGFSMRPEKLAETMEGPTVSWMKEKAKKHKTAICGSLIIAEGKPGSKKGLKYYNRFVWAMPNGELFSYDKRHLFSPANEDRHYTAGKEKIMINYRGWNIVPFVCFDLRFPVWCRNTGAEADLMLFVANWPAPRNNAWQQLLVARAIENQCYVAGVNRVGKDGNGMDHKGSSTVVDFLGNAVLKGPEKKSWVKTIEIEKKPLEDFRKKFPVWKEADEFDIFL